MLQEHKILKHFGIINKASEDKNIVITLENQENKVFKINILPELDHDIKWCNLEDKVKNKSFYSSSNEDFYLKYSENDNLIYCRFNNTSHPDAKELTLFKNMLEEKAKPKLIIDIRDNIGGMYTGNSPIVNMIRDSAYYNTKGNLFVIVGRKTFSSGLQYAFVPDHMIEYSIKDFLAGADPAIEKIRSQK